MSLLEYKLMGHLLTHSGVTGSCIKDLHNQREASKITSGCLYTTLKRCEDRGLIRSWVAPDGDGRLKRMSVTAKGHTAFEDTCRLYASVGDWGQRKLDRL